MSVSQCACFVHQPKRSHELALLQTRRYLKGTLIKDSYYNPKILIYSKLMFTLIMLSSVAVKLNLVQILTISNLVPDISLRSQVVQYCVYPLCK